MQAEHDNPLYRLIGHQLRAVAFVMDYLQFTVDDYILTAYTWPIIVVGGIPVGQHDQGYRDRLCERIGKPVRSAWVERDRLQVEFEDGSTLVVSLAEEDYVGPEAAMLYGTQPGSHTCAVW